MIPELTAKPCQLTVDEKTVAAETSYTTARDSTHNRAAIIPMNTFRIYWRPNDLKACGASAVSSAIVACW